MGDRMSQEDAMQELWNKWTKVWHEGRDDLLPECLAPVYTRHGSSIQSAFTVAFSREEYGRVLAAEREEFHLRFSIEDQAFIGDRMWFRATLYRTDPETGQQMTRAAIQVYRVEDGRLAETWVAYQDSGSAWPDAHAPD
jgi:hypothetical protein